jgi:hypothetical protein
MEVELGLRGICVDNCRGRNQLGVCLGEEWAIGGRGKFWGRLVMKVNVVGS